MLKGAATVISGCLVFWLGLLFPFESVSADALLVLGREAGLRRTLIVGPGPTTADAGANLLAALASVTAAADRPWLVRIEPGIYDLGQSRLQLKPHVDMEGSGRYVTILTGCVAGLDGLVQAAGDCEIRALTIRNTFAGDDYGVGFSTIDDGAVRLRNLRIEVPEGCRSARGIYSRESDLALIDTAVQVFGSDTTHGLYHRGGSIVVQGLAVAAAAGEGSLTGADYATGIYITTTGTGEAPARIENVRVDARGGNEAEGVVLYDVVAAAAHLDCSAEDTHVATAIRLDNSPGGVTLSHARARAAATTYAYGVVIARSGSHRISDLTAAAAGATDANTGIHFSDTTEDRSTRIDHSRVSGGSYSLYTALGIDTIYVGASRLDGPVATAGSWHCSRCYDGGNAALDGACQP